MSVNLGRVSIRQGGELRDTLQLQESDGTPLDLTLLDELEYRLNRRGPGGTTTVKKMTVEADRAFPDADDGEEGAISFIVPEPEFSLFEGGSYDLEVVATVDGHRLPPVAYGVIVVEPAKT